MISLLTYVEIIDAEPVEDYLEVHREQVGIKAIAVGSYSEPIEFSVPLPSSLLDPLREKPDTLVGRTFAMKVTITGPTRPPVTGFEVAFVGSSP